MYELISLLLGIASAVWIKRKGLTTVELRQYAEGQIARSRAKLVSRKLYRRACGGVWVKFDYAPWAHVRWCTTALDGYFVNRDGSVGVCHKRFVHIVAIEDYTKGSKQ